MKPLKILLLITYILLASTLLAQNKDDVIQYFEIYIEPVDTTITTDEEDNNTDRLDIFPTGSSVRVLVHFVTINGSDIEKIRCRLGTTEGGKNLVNVVYKLNDPENFILHEDNSYIVDLGIFVKPPSLFCEIEPIGKNGKKAKTKKAKTKKAKTKKNK